MKPRPARETSHARHVGVDDRALGNTVAIIYIFRGALVRNGYNKFGRQVHQKRRSQAWLKSTHRVEAGDATEDTPSMSPSSMASLGGPRGLARGRVPRCRPSQQLPAPELRGRAA